MWVLLSSNILLINNHIFHDANITHYMGNNIASHNKIVLKDYNEACKNK